MNRIADMGVTNVVLQAGKVLQSENMQPYMKLVTLKDGNVVFINTLEEYSQYITAGLLDA
jgi:predicted amidohydrolase YtcJ